VGGQSPRGRGFAAIREAGDDGDVDGEMVGRWRMEALFRMESAVEMRKMAQEITKKKKCILSTHAR